MVWNINSWINEGEYICVNVNCNRSRCPVLAICSEVIWCDCWDGLFSGGRNYCLFLDATSNLGLLQSWLLELHKTREGALWTDLRQMSDLNYYDIHL